MCCNLHNNITNHHLPQFIPNDYLWETHKDKGKEKWQIYAWACRDIMSKMEGKKTIEGTSLKDKMEFDKLTGMTHRKYD